MKRKEHAALIKRGGDCPGPGVGEHEAEAVLGGALQDISFNPVGVPIRVHHDAVVRTLCSMDVQEIQQMNIIAHNNINGGFGDSGEAGGWTANLRRGAPRGEVSYFILPFQSKVLKSEIGVGPQ